MSEFHVGVEHRHKYFLILNITLIYQIVKTDFQMNDIRKNFITYNSEKKDIFSREMRFQDFEFDFLSPLHLSVGFYVNLPYCVVFADSHDNGYIFELQTVAIL